MRFLFESKQKKAKKKRKKIEYFKALITWIVVNSTIWVYLTYGLAYQDKINVVEVLAIQIVTLILAPVITYAIKATIENIFKYNFKGKGESNNEKDELETEVDE